MARVLAFSCTHCPVMLDGYVDFLKDMYRAHSCDRVVHLGDLVDKHSISFHQRDPDLPGPEDELAAAIEQAQLLYAAFPKLDIITGNHDALTPRQAEYAGLPSRCIKSVSTILETPKGWRWHPQYGEVVIDGVIYRHGDSGKGGLYAAHKNAKDKFCSVVQGHCHTQAGAWWYANETALVWGLNVGCGIDREERAFRYAKSDNAKPIIGCGIVADGKYPVFEPMLL